MLKLWLKDFEFQINPTTWNTAQDIYAAGGVKSLREVERHFWVGLVEEDEERRFEIEAIITPHKIKAFTCECWGEGRRLICPHIAAALLKIRQFLDKKVEEKRAKAEAEKPEEATRFTIQTVLAKANPDELAEFVRDYARHDRDFALALKTWFAGGQENAAQHYRQLLDAVMPKIGPGKTLREPDFRRLRKMLDDLETQIETSWQQANFQTVFNVSAAVFQKIYPILEKTDGNRRQALLHFCQLAFRKITDLTEQEISPELHAAIWDFAFDLAAKRLFPVEMERDLLRFLAAGAAHSERFAQIHELFDRTPSPVPPFILHLYIIALAKRGMEKAGLRVLADYAEKPALIREAILHLYYLNYWPAALETGEFFIEKNIFTAGYRREVEDVLLHVAEKLGDKKRVQHILHQRFVQTNNFEVFRKLKQLTGAKWPKEFEKLLDALRKKNDSAGIAAALAEEGQTEVLGAFLEKENDLELLRRYEKIFLETDKNFIRRRYYEVLTTYLDEHFGRQASTHVREALSGLVQKGERQLVKEICDALLAHFTDRPSLNEELAELFPKTRRPSTVLL